MTFAFFDFYPMVGRSSTLGDVLDQSLLYALFLKSNLLVLAGYFIFSLSVYSAAFKRKNLVYALPISLLLMLFLGLIEKNFLTMRLSDIWMKVGYNFSVVCLAFLMLFFIPAITIRLRGVPIHVCRFRSISSIQQISLITGIFVSSCAYGHWSYLPVLVLTMVYGVTLMIRSRNLQPTSVVYTLNDSLPLIVIVLVGLGLSYVKVGHLVCNMPYLSQFFNCYQY